MQCFEKGLRLARDSIRLSEIGQFAKTFAYHCATRTSPIKKIAIYATEDFAWVMVYKCSDPAFTNNNNTYLSSTEQCQNFPIELFQDILFCLKQLAFYWYKLNIDYQGI